MKRILSFLVFVLIGVTQVVYSQEYSRKFGKVSPDEFKATACPIDETAEAMIIHDIGKVSYSFIGDSYKVIYERKVKFRIFTKAGLSYADFAIPFYHNYDKEKISGLKGNVYNLQDGKVVVTKLNTKNAYEEKVSENWNQLKFAMPDVKEGSIFEISYSVISPFVTDMPSWKFQRKIPVLLSEYTVQLNPHFEFKSLLKGAVKFDEYEVNDAPEKITIGRIPMPEKIHHFVMRNIPAFKDESYMASEDDYLIKLDFQFVAFHYSDGKSEYYTSTWPKLCKELMERDMFGKYLRASERKSKPIIEELKLDSLKPLEKAKILEKYVKTKFNSSGFNSYMAASNVDDFFKSKSGNSANANLLLCGLLNAAGIEARPVILSTRGNGQLQTFTPFLSGFNYVIVAATIDNNNMLLDATDPLSNFGSIPTKCINDKGLIVQENKTEWIDLVSHENSTIRYDLTIKPNLEDETIMHECTITSSGYDAINFRRKYQDDYDNLAENLLGINYKTFDSIQPVNLLMVEEPFEVKFNKSMEMETIEEKIMIDPFCSLVITENPMKQTERTYPIDFTYNSSQSFSTIIEVPEGYRLLNKPENMVINNPFGRVVYVTKEDEGNKVSVIAHFQFTKIKYEGSAYKDLKEIYNSVINKFNEKIVLVKNDVNGVI